MQAALKQNKNKNSAILEFTSQQTASPHTFCPSFLSDLLSHTHDRLVDLLATWDEANVQALIPIREDCSIQVELSSVVQKSVNLQVGTGQIN